MANQAEQQAQLKYWKALYASHITSKLVYKYGNCCATKNPIINQYLNRGCFWNMGTTISEKTSTFSKNTFFQEVSYFCNRNYLKMENKEKKRIILTLQL